MGIHVIKKPKSKRKVIKSKRTVKMRKSKRWQQITNRKRIWYLENRIKALEKRVFSPPDAYVKVLIVDSEKESE